LVVFVVINKEGARVLLGSVYFFYIVVYIFVYDFIVIYVSLAIYSMQPVNWLVRKIVVHRILILHQLYPLTGELLGTNPFLSFSITKYLPADRLSNL